MKLFPLCLLLIQFGCLTLSAQNYFNTGINTTTPDSSALLELNSQDKGFLMPRLTAAQRLAIPNPAKGLMVYDTDSDNFWFFDGTVWVQAIGPMGPAGPQGPQGAQGNQGLPGPTGPLVPGTLGQTLFHNGSTWTATSNLFHNNTNVGIGTVNPVQKLDVTGSIRATDIVYWGGDGSRTESRNDAGQQGNAGARSGFFETSNPVNFPAGANSWWHLLDVRHSNSANNYAMQLSGSFFDQELYFRKTNNNSGQAWRRVKMDDELSYTSEYCLNQGSNPQTLNLTALNNVNTQNGVCFLTYVRGKFEGGAEWVHVATSGTDWILQVNSNQSDVRACARCIRLR